MRFTTSQTSFRSGRLSPKLYNRVDTKQYGDGASEIEGFRVLPEGGAEKAKSIRYINESAFQSGDNIQEATQFSVQINGKPIVVTLCAQDSGDFQLILYVHEYPYNHGTGTRLELTTTNLPGDPIPPLGTNPSSYLDARLFDWAVKDTNVYVTHFSGGFPPFIIKFDEDGTFDEVILYERELATKGNTYYGYPMDDFRDETITFENYDNLTNQIDIVTTDADALAALQASTVIYAERLGSRKNDGDDNRYTFIASNYYVVTATITGGVTAQPAFGLADDNSAGFLEVLLFSSGGTNPTATTTSNTWAVNLWGFGNYPKTVTHHEGRLVMGGTNRKPMTFFGSKVNNPLFFNQVRSANSGSSVYTNNSTYAGAILPSDPYVFTTANETDTEICVLKAGSELFIGTDKAEYIATGGDTTLSALSVQVKPYSNKGSYPLISASIDGAVAHVDSTRKRLFLFKFNDANGSTTSQELSLLFRDLMENDQIREIEWCPHVTTMFVLTDNGNLYGIAYDPQVELVAFYKTTITNASTLAYVAARNVPTLPTGTYHRGDHLLFISTSGLFTYEQTFYELGDHQPVVEMVDRNSYMYFKNAQNVVRTGATAYNINGESVAVPNDKFPININSPAYLAGFPLLVTNVDTGEVVEINSLDPNTGGSGDFELISDPAIDGASEIVFGNTPDPTLIATMPVEAGQQWGTAQMGIKRIDELGIRHYRSYSYDISSDGQKWQEVRVADKVGLPTNGREEVKFSSDHKYDSIVYIRSTKPEPLTITGINMRGVSNDG